MRSRHSVVVAAAILVVAGHATAQESVAPVDTATRVARLVSQLGAPDAVSSQRMQAAAGLGELGLAAKGAADALAGATKDTEEDVRVFAAQSLGAIGAVTSRVQDALAARLDDDSMTVRAVAGRSLAKLHLADGTKVVLALESVLEKGSHSDRTLAFMALRDLGRAAAAAAEAVRRRAEHEDETALASTALARMGPAGVKQLALLAASSRPAPVRRDARSAAAEFLPDAIDARGPEVGELLSVVSSGLRDADEQLRLMAVLQIGVLGHFPGLDDEHRAALADRLEATARREDESRTVRELARSTGDDLRKLRHR